jgi:hypothetical protein
MKNAKDLESAKVCECSVILQIRTDALILYRHARCERQPATPSNGGACALILVFIIPKSTPVQFETVSCYAATHPLSTHARFLYLPFERERYICVTNSMARQGFQYNFSNNRALFRVSRRFFPHMPKNRMNVFLVTDGSYLLADHDFLEGQLPP